jgi:hypothetical protein
MSWFTAICQQFPADDDLSRIYRCPQITARYRSFVAICLLFFCSLSGAQELQILTENWPPVSFGIDTKADGMAVEVVRAIQKNRKHSADSGIAICERIQSLTRRA